MSRSLESEKRDLERRAAQLDEREAAVAAHELHQRMLGELGDYYTYRVKVDAHGRLELPWIPGPAAPIGGFTNEEALELGWTEIIHPEDRKFAWQLLRTALHEGRASGKYRLLRGDSIRWVRNSIARVRNERGEIQLLGLTQNMTDLHRTQEALRASEHSFEVLFRSAPVVMLLSAVEGGRLIDVNDRFSEVTGYTHAEAIGKTATELGLWKSAQQRDDFRQVRQEREKGFEGLEAHLRSKSGDTIVALLSAEAVELGGRSRIVWHAVDISERKRIEGALARYREDLELLVEARTEELEVSRQQLRHSERLASIGTLAAGIAHQINNPVGVILAASQHALDCEGDADVHAVWRTALEESERHAQRCARIVKSVLQFARDEQTQKWPDDLNTTLRRACNLTRSYAEERGAEVSLREAEAPVSALINPIELEQVLVNVIRNAIESKSEGARVEVAITRDADGAEISIQDDGRGIPDFDLRRVFDPFFTTRLEEGGTGLGLSVAHGIVASHGGQMRIESPTGAGCRVTIELPLTAAGEAD